jgi:PAS domain S-box-containing protein
MLNSAGLTESARDPSRKTDSSEGGRKHRILYVEDSVTQQLATATLLQRAGFEMHQAATGAQALQMAAALQPDLVLLDVVLPDASGYDICQQLKTNTETMDTVVLLLSNLGTRAQERALGLESGADGYLRKPVTPEELKATIYALLRIRYAEERAAAACGQLSAILECCDDAIICTDSQGKVLTWSLAAERLYGYSAEQMQGTLISQLDAGDSAEQLQGLRCRALAGETVRGQLLSRLASGGVPQCVAVTVCPICDGKGNIVGVCEVGRKRDG